LDAERFRTFRAHVLFGAALFGVMAVITVPVAVLAPRSPQRMAVK
jgi:hypothetical protein